MHLFDLNSDINHLRLLVGNEITEIVVNDNLIRLGFTKNTLDITNKLRVSVSGSERLLFNQAMLVNERFPDFKGKYVQQVTLLDSQTLFLDLGNENSILIYTDESPYEAIVLWDEKGSFIAW